MAASKRSVKVAVSKPHIRPQYNTETWAAEIRRLYDKIAEDPCTDVASVGGNMQAEEYRARLENPGLLEKIRFWGSVAFVASMLAILFMVWLNKAMERSRKDTGQATDVITSEYLGEGVYEVRLRDGTRCLTFRHGIDCNWKEE